MKPHYAGTTPAIVHKHTAGWFIASGDRLVGPWRDFTTVERQAESLGYRREMSIEREGSTIIIYPLRSMYV